MGYKNKIEKNRACYLKSRDVKRLAQKTKSLGELWKNSIWQREGNILTSVKQNNGQT